MSLRIHTFPEDATVLRTKCKSVSNVTEEYRILAGEMLKTMAESETKAIGLSANQVGSLIRLFVLDTRNYKDGFVEVFFNPKIIRMTNRQPFEEGCLSSPGKTCIVNRFMDIGVQYLDLSGKKRVRTLRGIHAVAFQHELDHLDGISMEDYAKPKEEKNE